MTFTFNREQIIMIINEYKKYPELYDRLNENYNDTGRRYDCWLGITQKLISTFDIFPTIHDVKHKIKTLRTQLAHETTKEKKMKIRNRPYRSTWYYYKMLIFLVKGGFIEKKGSKTDSNPVENCSSETATSSYDMGFQDNSSLSFYDPLELDCKPEIHPKTEYQNLVNDASTTSSYKDSKFQFTREHIETIIELYKNYPELYNMQHPQYYDKERKLKCWKDITEQLSAACNISASLEDIKHKIRLLRTQYTHEIRRERRNKEIDPNGEKYKSYWWCFNLLSFLSEQNSLKGKKNSHSHFSSTSEQNSAMEETESHNMVSEISQLEDVLDIYDVECSYPPSLQETSDEESKSSIKQKSHSKRRSPIITYTRKPESPEDDLSVFAQYIQTELRRIKDKKKITRLKRNIINLVYDAIDEDEN